MKRDSLTTLHLVLDQLIGLQEDCKDTSVEYLQNGIFPGAQLLDTLDELSILIYDVKCYIKDLENYITVER